MVKKRSRRLRKKLYVDEFAVEGFEFSCVVSASKQSDYDRLLDDFVEFLEGNDLIAGAGAGSNSFDGFISGISLRLRTTVKQLRNGFQSIL